MANDYNYFGCIGRLTRDAEIKYTTSGTPVVNFSIAVNKKISKEKEYVNFFEFELWGNYGVILEKYLKKGQQIQVSGEIKQQRWEDKNTNTKKSKIIFTVKELQLLGGLKQNISNEILNNNNYEDPYKNNNNDDDSVPF